MKKNARSVLAIELSPASLKLAEFLPLENQVALVAEVPLDANQWSNDAYLQERIRAAVGQHVSSRVAEWVTSVSGEHALIRQVEIPNAEDDVQSALTWDMSQYLAHPPEEYLMDWQALGPNREETARVFLLAAYRKSEVLRLRNLMEQAGQALAVMDVDVFAAQNVFEINYPEQLPLKTLLIKADLHSVKCIRTHHGSFLGFETHSVDESLADLGHSEKKMRLEELALKVRRMVENAQEEWGALESCLVCGDLSLDADFLAALEAQLPMDIGILDPFRHIPLGVLPSQGEELRQNAARYASVVGLALRRGGDC